MQGIKALIPGKILFSENPNDETIIKVDPIKKKKTIPLCKRQKWVCCILGEKQ